MASRGLTASDVVRAMREQNVQVSAGQLGAEPLPDSKFLTLINAQGRLKTEKEFGDIVLKSGTDGEIVRLSDVARRNWARATTPCARSWTARTRWVSASSSRRVPTRWKSATSHLDDGRDAEDHAGRCEVRSGV